MKTQINISSLKRMTLTTCFALMITAGSLTSLRAESPASDYATSLIRLEKYLNATEDLMKYTVPEVLETEKVSAELERLDNLFGAIETSMKYEAIENDETDSMTSEVERLDLLASATEASMKYKAPTTEEFDLVTPALERLDILATATEVFMKYEAPSEIIEADNNDNLNINSTKILMADKTR